MRRVTSRSTFVFAAALIALTLVAFAPALGNGFVNWDDSDNYLTNEHFRGLGSEQLRWAWTTYHMGSYQPLSWTFASIEFALWGLDPHGYHAASIVIHAITVLALFLLIREVLQRAHVPSGIASDAFAAVAAAWYGVHPLRVEVVAWATGQANLLCAMFFAGAILAYVRASDANAPAHPRWIMASLLLFLASLLSKAPSVGLPFVLLVLDVYPLRKIRGGAELWSSIGSAIRQKIWFFALAAAFSIVAFQAKAHTFTGVVNQRGLLSRFAAAAYSGWFYLGKMIAPTDLVVFYRWPGPPWWRSPVFLMSLLTAMAAGVGLLWLLWKKRFSAATAASVAFLVLLAPVSGFVSISTQLVADRHSHLIAMPCAVLLAGALSWVRRVSPRPLMTTLLAVASVAGLAFLTISTRELCRVWRDSEALWTHALQYPAGQTMMAYNNLASVHLDRGDTAAATALLRTAVTQPVDPTDLTGRLLVHVNLAEILVRRGAFDDAIAQYSEMARLAPNSPDVHYHWGEALAAQGKLDDAIAHYSEALRLAPDHSRAGPALDMARRRRGSP